MQTIKICRGFQVPQRWDLNLSHDSASDSGSDSDSDCDFDSNSDCDCVCALVPIRHTHTHKKERVVGGGGCLCWRSLASRGTSESLANGCAVGLFAFRIFSPLEEGVCVGGEGVAWHACYLQCLLNKFLHMF